MNINGSNGVCPTCYSPIPEDRKADPVIVCSQCGRTNSQKEAQLEKRSQRRSMSVMIISSVLMVGAFIHIVNWNEHSLEVIPLKVKQVLGAADRSDYIRMADICRDELKPECVEKNYQEIVKSAPSDLEAISLLGKVQVNRGRMSQGVDTLSRYFQLGGIDLETSYYYAKALGATGNIEEASQYYQMILNSRPDVLQITVAQSYVHLLIENQRLKEAKELIEEIRDKGSNTRYFLQTELRQIEDTISNKN